MKPVVSMPYITKGREAFCDSCQREADCTVTVGEPQHWDTRTAALCENCLAEAMTLMHKALREAGCTCHIAGERTFCRVHPERIDGRPRGIDHA